MDFNTRTSRLFSGDPSALFAPDAAYYSVGVVSGALTSPFQFQLDTDQCPYTQFWHIPKLNVMIFSPNDLITGLVGNQMRLYLMPNNLVGSQVVATPGSNIAGINPNNLGVELTPIQGNLINSAAPPNGGMQTYEVELPIDVPPGWFLRFVILDNGAGPILPADCQITMRMMREIIQIQKQC